MSVKDQIRSYIEEYMLFGDPVESDDLSLLESGLVDSTGTMELVLFIEEEFNVVADDSEIIPENFESVNSITAFVERKQKAAA